jgi:hypothetical protein
MANAPTYLPLDVARRLLAPSTSVKYRCVKDPPDDLTCHGKTVKDLTHIAMRRTFERGSAAP